MLLTTRSMHRKLIRIIKKALLRQIKNAIDYFPPLIPFDLLHVSTTRAEYIFLFRILLGNKNCLQVISNYLKSKNIETFYEINFIQDLKATSIADLLSLEPHSIDLIIIIRLIEIFCNAFDRPNPVSRAQTIFRYR